MRTRGARRRRLMALTAIAVTTCGVAPATAAAHEHSFDGTCLVQGTVHFSPGATNTPQLLTFDYRADGSCSGTLDGRNVNDVPVTWHNAGQAEGSCMSAHTVAPGHGTIAFPDGSTIAFSFTFTAVATETDFSFTGQRAGTAHGHATFLTDRTPPDIAAQCAGAGASDVPMDLGLVTETPLVSGSSGSQPPRHRPGNRRHSPRLTFDGDCQLFGMVTFTPAATTDPQPITQHARASGTCSGSLADGKRTRHFNDAPVTYASTEHGAGISCPSGEDGGHGVLEFRWGGIRFALSEHRVGPLADLSYTGLKGGSAEGVAIAQGDPAATLQKCGGSGLARAPISIRLSTTPRMSG